MRTYRMLFFGALMLLVAVIADISTSTVDIVSSVEAGRRDVADKMEFWLYDTVPGTNAIWHSTRHMIPRPQIGESVTNPEDLNLKLALSHARKMHDLQRPADVKQVEKLQAQAIARYKSFVSNDGLVLQARELQEQKLREFFDVDDDLWTRELEREIVPRPGHGGNGGPGSTNCQFGEPDCDECGTKVPCPFDPQIICACDLACIDCAAR